MPTREETLLGDPAVSEPEKTAPICILIGRPEPLVCPVS